MNKKEYSLDIVPFIVPRAEAAKIEAIQQQHEILVGKSERITEENISQVNDFLESIAQAGAVIRNPEYRSQLRALNRYWSSFVNEKTQRLPIIELQPYIASQAEDIQPQDFTEALETVTAEVELLLAYKKQLESLRVMLLYGMSMQEITQTNINMIERELRSIIGGTEKLRHLPYIKHLIRSIDALQSYIIKAIRHLYLISDLLRQKLSIRARETLYQKLSELPELLEIAIKQFTIDEETLEKMRSFNQYPEQLG